MPKRRKRNKSSSAKPPLTFAASPVNIVHNLPSPVFGADHPLTADVVPVEQDHYPWVQPEFNRLDPEDSRRKPRRTRGSKPQIKGIDGADNEQSIQTRQKSRNSKLVPLQFTCDKDSSVVSVLENITDFEEKQFDVPLNRYDIVNTSNKPYTVLVPTGNYRECITDEKEEEVPRISENYSIRDENLRITKQHSFLGTQKRPDKSRKLKPSKRLFNESSDILISKPENSLVGEQITEFQGTPCQNKGKRCLLKNVSDESDKNKNVTPFQSPSIPCEYGSINTPTEKRHSMRIRNRTLFDLANTTILGPLSDRHFKVLVPDTPEADYGLSAQERRLKEYYKTRLHPS